MPPPAEFEDLFTQLNPFLLGHGWLFPPKLIGGETRELWDRCEQYRAMPPGDVAARQAAYAAIDRVLVFHAAHENTRAYNVWISMQQPFMREFSHLIENGVIHYYRRDFLAAVHCLIPAVEGVLRSHYAAHMPPVPPHELNQGMLRNFLRAGRPTRSYPAWHKMYREALADFLQQWLWQRTDRADWNISFLNRHYALHGAGTDPYYRSADCHRLFVFLELYAAMLTLETGVGEDGFIPNDPGIERRRTYYEGVRQWAEVTQDRSRHVALLREHPHFHHEPIAESFLQKVIRWAGVMGFDRFPPINNDGPRR